MGAPTRYFHADDVLMMAEGAEGWPYRKALIFLDTKYDFSGVLVRRSKDSRLLRPTVKTLKFVMVVLHPTHRF